MRVSSRFSTQLCLCLFLVTTAVGAIGQSVPAPKDVLGFTPGDDRKLASWAQVVDYFKKLDAASDRVQFQEIGKTTVGVPFVYATISTPANLRNLERYKRINAQLADPRLIGRNDTTAQRLIRDGKTIVLITCGVHSTEVGSYLSSMLIAHRLASSNEPEVRRILENSIVLLVPSLNPDGVDIVKNWYDKTLGTKFEGTAPPELYHKYVGHDDNRDWYMFTQVETQHTVDKIHNVWHPQIVHDIHQQGENGSRLFLPPYMAPVEPNVPKEIVEGYTELGNAMAEGLRQKGLQGITTNSTYDAWTPARAYSHHHGGVRILSETASARLATPVTKKFEDLRVPADDGYDPKKESANFGPLWLGGDWRLRNITEYMTSAAFALLGHAADNREKWLSRFYEVGKEAVRPRKAGELHGISFFSNNGADAILEKILIRGGVEVERSQDERAGKGYRVVRADQPYFSFAKAVLERQAYPDLKDETGQPLPPYDVTAHTLPLLMNVNARFIDEPFRSLKIRDRTVAAPPPCRTGVAPGIYRSWPSSMDEGWTRWILENYEGMKPLGPSCPDRHQQIFDADIRRGGLISKTKTIIFPDQTANQILNGYARDAMPEEYTGGIGRDGVENLKRFVEAGGTLVFLNRASNFAIQQFNLPIRDVTQGVPRRDLYIPGSILRTEVDTTNPLAKGLSAESIAWFENSPAFEVQTDPAALTNNFRIIARYPSDASKVLLSGWAFGTDRIAGKAAAIEWKMGSGRIVLYGFRPQYRGQSLETFPLLFNAIS